MYDLLKRIFSIHRDASCSAEPELKHETHLEMGVESLPDNASDEEMLAYICENDPIRMEEARHNEKYRAFLTELRIEKQISDMFYLKYGINLDDIYAGEIRLDWQRFSRQIENFPDRVTNEDCIDGAYVLLMNAARRIERYYSFSPSFNNSWPEQIFNQIRSVMTVFRDEIKPIFEIAQNQQDLQNEFNIRFTKIRERFQPYCTKEDSYWMYVIDNLEPPLRKALNILNT